MANIAVRKENGNRTQLAQQVPEMARWMRNFFEWDPFREMSTLMPEARIEFNPAFEVKETKEGYSFKADLPGVKESDVEVTLTGNRLNISGKREAEKEEKTDTYYACERSYGSFLRAFTLPDGIDGNSVRADLKDGVLTVSIKKSPELQPKKIAVQTQATKS